MVVASAILVVVSCKHEDNQPCKIDTDCPTGSFCRESECANVGGDGGVAPDGAIITCASPGDICALDSDCCSPPCNTSGRCAGGGTSSGGTSGGRGSSGTSGTSGTSGGTGGCQDVFGLCTLDTDCCTPLMCGTNSTCQ